MSNFINPFDSCPWPNMIRIGFGDENVLYCEIENTGDVKFYDDPLGPAVLTLKPEYWETMKFIGAHLEHFHIQPAKKEPAAARIVGSVKVGDEVREFALS